MSAGWESYGDGRLVWLFALVQDANRRRAQRACAEEFGAAMPPPQTIGVPCERLRERAARKAGDEFREPANGEFRIGEHARDRFDAASKLVLGWIGHGGRGRRAARVTDRRDGAVVERADPACAWRLFFP